MIDCEGQLVRWRHKREEKFTALPSVAIVSYMFIFLTLQKHKIYKKKRLKVLKVVDCNYSVLNPNFVSTLGV